MKLTFKEAWAIWRGKTKPFVEYHITIWTLVLLGISEIPHLCMEMFAHYFVHKLNKK